MLELYFKLQPIDDAHAAVFENRYICVAYIQYIRAVIAVILGTIIIIITMVRYLGAYLRCFLTIGSLYGVLASYVP